MAKKPVHTVPAGNKWENTQGGKTISSHNTKENAETEGRRQAKRDQTEHVIQKKDGKIQKKTVMGMIRILPRIKNNLISFSYLLL